MRIVSSLVGNKCGSRPGIRHRRIQILEVLDLLGGNASLEAIREDDPFL